jgi:hypothetical protein
VVPGSAFLLLDHPSRRGRRSYPKKSIAEIGGKSVFWLFPAFRIILLSCVIVIFFPLPPRNDFGMSLEAGGADMTPDSTPGPIRAFSTLETQGILVDFARRFVLVPSEDGKRILCSDPEGMPRWEVSLPLLQPIPDGPWDYHAYLASLDRPPGTVFVLLLQAGACSMGLWRDSILVRHKVIKKYVVRGQGRAQPGYLKTKGKSRFGSRLRLRNAKSLLQEANEKMVAWWEAEGPFARVFASCPVRLWPELFGADPPPPFPQRGFHSRIPLTVKVPSFDELGRVWWHLSHGRVTEQQGARREER